MSIFQNAKSCIHVEMRKEMELRKYRCRILVIPICLRFRWKRRTWRTEIWKAHILSGTCSRQRCQWLAAWLLRDEHSKWVAVRSDKNLPSLNNKIIRILNKASIERNRSIQIDIFKDLSKSFHGREEVGGITRLFKISSKRAFENSLVIIVVFQLLRFQIIFSVHYVIFCWEWCLSLFIFPGGKIVRNIL